MKRNCRRTDDESRIHEKAVRLRKMTDKQLVDYVESFSRMKTIQEKSEVSKTSIDKIMDDIGAIRGVGITKLHYIRQILENRLEVGNG